MIKDECISLLLELSGTLRTAVAGCWAGKWGSPRFSVGSAQPVPRAGLCSACLTAEKGTLWEKRSK